MIENDVVEAPRPKPKITRREFPKRLALAAAGFLTACGERTPQVPIAPDAIPDPTETIWQVVPDGQIIPGEYSTFINKNDLAPRAISPRTGESEEAFAQRQIEAGINYLTKFRDSGMSSELRRVFPTLKDYGVVENNFPISIPDNDPPWDIYDIANTFLNELALKKTTMCRMRVDHP